MNLPFPLVRTGINTKVADQTVGPVFSDTTLKVTKCQARNDVL